MLVRHFYQRLVNFSPNSFHCLTDWQKKKILIKITFAVLTRYLKLFGCLGNYTTNEQKKIALSKISSYELMHRCKPILHYLHTIKVIPTFSSFGKSFFLIKFIRSTPIPAPTRWNIVLNYNYMGCCCLPNSYLTNWNKK